MQVLVALRQTPQQLEETRVRVLDVVDEHDEDVEVRKVTLENLVVQFFHGVKVRKIEQQDALQSGSRVNDLRLRDSIHGEFRRKRCLPVAVAVYSIFECRPVSGASSFSASTLVLGTCSGAG